MKRMNRMTKSGDHLAAGAVLDARLNAILPEEYQDAYDDVKPVSMGSAGLKFGADGQVAWNDMWATFCDLAMAGGPPHKGTLLEPSSAAAIEAAFERYVTVVGEICRGIELVSGLRAHPSPVPGWVRVTCHSQAMAAWLVRAIVMENVAAHAEGMALDLPAAPTYRLEKEIKNVVTVIAKTCHYWLGHMPRAQQRAIGRLFVTMAGESPLVTPPSLRDGISAERQQRLSARMAESLQRRTGLRPSAHRYTDWIGVECPSVRAAIWMMRALVVSNVLARREETTLFVPVNPAQDPKGDRVATIFARVHSLGAARKLF